MRKILLGLIFLISLTGIVNAHIGSGDEFCGMMEGGMGWWGMSGGILGLTIMVLVGIVLVLLIIWLIKQIQISEKKSK